MVQQGLTAATLGKQSAESVQNLFAGINANTAEVLEQAQQICQMNEQLQQSSQKVLEEITTVAAFTEQSAASVEEVLTSADVQQQHVSDIVESIRQLTELTNKLEGLIKQ